MAHPVYWFYIKQVFSYMTHFCQIHSVWNCTKHSEHVMNIFMITIKKRHLKILMGSKLLCQQFVFLHFRPGDAQPGPTWKKALRKPRKSTIDWSRSVSRLNLSAQVYMARHPDVTDYYRLITTIIANDASLTNELNNLCSYWFWQ